MKVTLKVCPHENNRSGLLRLNDVPIDTAPSLQSYLSRKLNNRPATIVVETTVPRGRSKYNRSGWVHRWIGSWENQTGETIHYYRDDNHGFDCLCLCTKELRALFGRVPKSLVMTVAEWQ